jgi:hypothetical protein
MFTDGREPAGTGVEVASEIHFGGPGGTRRENPTLGIRCERVILLDYNTGNKEINRYF